MRIEKYDYAYDLTDEQLLYFSSLPAIAKLRWLDEARRFTLMARSAPRTYYRDGIPVETVVPSVQDPEAEIRLLTAVERSPREPQAPELTGRKKPAP